MPNASKEKSIEYTLRWQQKHPEKFAASKKRNCEYRKEKYRTDPEFREKVKRYARERRREKREELNERKRVHNLTDQQIAARRRYNRTEKRRRSIRDHLLRRNYGITLEQYETLLAEQHGVCAICRGTHTPEDRWKSGNQHLRVDHDHKTGKVRGLLCFHCNTALGHFRDNTFLVVGALAYLTRYETV